MAHCQRIWMVKWINCPIFGWRHTSIKYVYRTAGRTFQSKWNFVCTMNIIPKCVVFRGLADDGELNSNTFTIPKHYFRTCEHYTTKMPILVVYRNNAKQNSITYIFVLHFFPRNGTTNKLFNFVQINIHTSIYIAYTPWPI